MTSNISILQRRRLALRAGLLSASAGAALLGASPAMAQCAIQPGSTAICSGDNGAAQNVDVGGSVNVTTTPGFSVDSGTTALNIRGVGAVGYDDAHASALTGRGGDGLLIVNNSGAGLVSVRTAGNITGTNRGILVNNLGNGGIRIESTGTVSGGVRGISALAVANLGASLNDDIEILSNNGSGEIGVGAENRGGNGSIRITSTGTASGTVVTGFGISAFNSITAAGRDIVIDANNIGGVGGGINSTNRGTGSTDITVNGTIDVAGRQGVTATNEAAATDLSVTTNGAVTSGTTSITIQNLGRGDTTINARAQLTSNNLTPEASVQSGNGINAVNGATARNILINAAGVEGRAGIMVNNAGSGTTTLTATGLVKGRDGRGVDLTVGATSGAIDVDLAAVEGATDGIFINAGLSADAELTVKGPVTAGRDGVRIFRPNDSVGETDISLGDVSGDESGVSLTMQGTGRTSITSTGTLSGPVSAGLSFFSRGAIDADLVNATGFNGVVISTASDEASIDLTATGTLTGTGGDGLFVGNAGPILLDINNSSGTRNGVTLSYTGTSEARLISRGTATGGASGVRATTNDGVTGGLFLDINNATGGDYGVSVQTRGLGGTELVTRGTIEGGIAAIDAAADGGATFNLTNAGTIRNRTAASADLAIQAVGGPVDILNNGILLGTVRLDAGIVVPEPEPEEPGRELRARSIARSGFAIAEVPDVAASHRLTNANSWNSIGGTSVFGGEDDVLINLAGGRLLGGIAAATAETTSYSGLETLTNQGTITMADGGFGDIVQTSGNANFAAGSVLAVDAGGTGSDRFIADGATTIEAGALLRVSNPQPLVAGTRYTILESAGGVTGSFTFADELQSAFLGFRQGQTETEIFVELARLRTFAAAGATPNQTAVGGALDGLAATNALSQAALALPTDAAAQAAFDALSGEIHPGVRTAMIEESRLPRHAVLERLDGGTGGAVWGQAFGNWGNSDGRDGVADLDRKTIGGVIGADLALGETTIVGVAGGYLETDLDVSARSSSAKLKSWHLLGYAGVDLGGITLKLGGGYASASIDTDRTVAFPGIGQQLSADYDGSLLHGFADLGYRVPLGSGHIEPFAQIVALRADTDAFAETGGSAAVAGAKTDENATLSSLGARFSTGRAGAFSVGGTIAWQHGFGGLTPASTMRFAGGADFTVIGAPRSRNAGVATLDAQFALSERAQISVAYDGVLGSAGQDHSVKAGLRIAF